MPLTLDPKCQNRVRELLTTYLGSARVSSGNYLAGPADFLLKAETALPQTGPLHERLVSLVGERPFITFVFDTLHRELQCCQQHGARPKDASLLESLPHVQDAEQLAARLMQQFESLPWKYTISVQAPGAFSAQLRAIESFELSESIAIVGGATARRSHPLDVGISGRPPFLDSDDFLIDPRSREFDDESAYVQIKTEGFVGMFRDSEPLIEATGHLKALYGLCIALNLLEPPRPLGGYARENVGFVHKLEDGIWCIDHTCTPPPRQSASMDIHKSFAKLASESERAAFTLSTLQKISAVFAAKERTASLRLGSQWLFDSYCGTDELLTFIQATVVVEILLGDKAISDQTGLGELLANRCAYLIASSHSERQEVLRDFRAIYSVRSSIVHRGKSRLAMREKALFNRLRWMCSRIISEEVKLHANDS